MERINNLFKNLLSNKRKLIDITITLLLIPLGLIITIFVHKIIGILLVIGGFIASHKELLSALKYFKNLNIDIFGNREEGQSITDSNHAIQMKTRDVKAPIYNINAPISAQALKELSKEKEVVNIKEFKEGKFNHKEIKRIDLDNAEFEESKKLLKKIHNFLEETKPLSIIAEMSLRLCQNLNIKNYSEWLKNEVYGYEEPTDNRPLEYRQRDDTKNPKYRSIDVELYLTFQGDGAEKFDLRFFITKPISIIENWVNSAGNSKHLILTTAPLKLMVENLKVNPNEKIPYVIKTDSLRNLLSSFRIELNKFLEEVRNKISKIEKISNKK